MSTVGVILAVVSTALAVDLGRLAGDKRTDQKVADLAALDASRDLTQACARAKASVVRNGFAASTLNCVDPASSPTGDVMLGDMVNGTFTPSASGKAVQVKVHSAFKTVFPFVTGPNGLNVSAVASSCSFAGFSLGSSLVSLDSSRSSLLNPLIGGMLGGSSLSLSLVSWQGLASGNLTLQALQTQLASMGLSVGSVSSLLSAQMTAAQFFQAAANALTAQGDLANASIMNTLKLAAPSNVKFNLGQFINVAQGSEGVALGSRFDLFQLVSAAAEATAVNGGSFIDVSNVAISVPNVSSVALHLRVIQPPVFYIGTSCNPPSVSSGQVQLTVTPTVNGLTMLGLVQITNSAVPINITAAGATGTLKSVSCSGTPGITVTVDPQAFSGSAATNTIHVTTLLNVPVLDVQTTQVTPSVDGPPVDVSFNYPGEFTPTAASKHVGSQPIGLQSLTNVTSGTVTVLGLIPLGLTQASIVAAVLSSLHTVIGNIDNSILTPLLSSLGLDIGGADVTALADAFNPSSCGQPRLIS
jgi:uncharacterized membrane protein